MSKEEKAGAHVEDKPPGWWRPVLLVAIIISMLILAKVFDLGHKLGELRTWIDGLGPLGAIVFILLYTMAAVAAIPGSALTVTAGALFGSVLGVILVSIASTLGAGLSFLIARYFARNATARWLSRNENFRKLDQLTEEQGAVMVALTRLVPIFPFNLLNYGFGLTRVPFWTYVFWSWLCMLPMTIVYVVGADAFTKGLAQGKVPWNLIGVVIGMGIILSIVIRQARRRLRSKEIT
jgi:uncharacterized membrane protein YdjX (TVP38/TMEM64 family)